MARVPLTKEEVAPTRLVLNVEKVGLSEEQFFQLCSDNRDLRMELTAPRKSCSLCPGRDSKAVGATISFQRSLRTGLKRTAQESFVTHRPATDCRIPLSADRMFRGPGVNASERLMIAYVHVAVVDLPLIFSAGTLKDERNSGAGRRLGVRPRN